MNYKNAYEEMKRLYTKLQQENEQLKEKIRITKEHPFISKFYEGGRGYGKTLITDLEQRIDKAIEHLELKKMRYLNEPDYRICTLDLEEIKDILKGENNG